MANRLYVQRTLSPGINPVTSHEAVVILPWLLRFVNFYRLFSPDAKQPLPVLHARGEHLFRRQALDLGDLGGDIGDHGGRSRMRGGFECSRSCIIR